MPEVMNRHMPNGGVDRPTIMLKQMMRPKWMMLMPIASATGHRIGIMTSWMTEVSTRQPRIRMMMLTANRKTYLLAVTLSSQLPRIVPICSLAKMKEMAEAAPIMMETEPVPFIVSTRTCLSVLQDMSR